MGNNWRSRFRAFLCGIFVRLPGLLCAVRKKRAAECLTACATTLTACIFHYAFVSWQQYALLQVALPAMVKGSVGFSATLALGWGVTAALRQIPTVARLI
jgi:hypothetical protein